MIKTNLFNLPFHLQNLGLNLLIHVLDFLKFHNLLILIQYDYQFTLTHHNLLMNFEYFEYFIILFVCY